MEEKLTVKTRDGQTWEIYVIMEFQVENYPDDYIAYTFGEKNGENVTSFISKMKEDNNTIILDSIQVNTITNSGHNAKYFYITIYVTCHYS